MNNIKKYAVIVAGGKGTRMGTDVPKQFLPLLGIPLMCHAVQAFASAIPDIRIILVLPEDQLGSAQTVLRSYMGKIEVATIAGGNTRFHSVLNGLSLVPDEEGIVFVHDGARPLIAEELIIRCYKQALEKGSAIPAIRAAESMRLIINDDSKALDRDKVRIIQTPQTFKTNIILPAFKQAYNTSFTDEASVVEAYGTSVHLIEGMTENIKVTRSQDMIIAEALLRSKS
jgi:2-C-methyl-D-erythritol 4-phosphate cytidylyltransferase